MGSITPTPRTLRVAIVGGGPGGLATAIALSKIPDVDVRVYEKDKILREVGAGINIGANSWNVLALLGVADSLVTGHQSNVVLNMNGRTGAQLHRTDRPGDAAWPHGAWATRPTIRTQRTALQAALLAHVPAGVLQLGKKLTALVDLDNGDGDGDGGGGGVRLEFADGAAAVADLVVGADGIRSAVRDAAWPGYRIAFTGTTIWRALLPLGELVARDARFGETGWWHLPASHVYFSPVGEGLGEIAAREYQDPAVFGSDKVVWGVPVTNAHVEGHFEVSDSGGGNRWGEGGGKRLTRSSHFLVAAGVYVRDPGGAEEGPRRLLARVRGVRGPGAGPAQQLGQQGRAGGGLVARAVGRLWGRGRFRHGGWVGDCPGAATQW